MQRVGLKHRDDFACRVPRCEVAECEALVREEWLELMRAETGLDDAALRHRLHARCLGSYLRGK